MEDMIRPSADLRNHYSDISKLCRETRQPVIITVNGRGDTAVLNLQEYRQMSAALEYLARLEKAVLHLSEFPYAGTEPRYSILRKQGYRVLIVEKQLIFYKVDNEARTVTIHAVVDGRTEYKNLI